MIDVPRRAGIAFPKSNWENFDMKASWCSARKGLVVLSAVAGLNGIIAIPAVSQPVLTPIGHPSLEKQLTPSSMQAQTVLICPMAAHVVHNAASQGNWQVYIGGFNMPLWTAAVQNNNATTDYLRCNYGGPGQFALIKPVKAGSCMLNANKNGFVCK